MPSQNHRVDKQRWLATKASADSRYVRLLDARVVNPGFWLPMSRDVTWSACRCVETSYTSRYKQYIGKFRACCWLKTSRPIFPHCIWQGMDYDNQYPLVVLSDLKRPNNSTTRGSIGLQGLCPCDVTILLFDTTFGK